MSATDVAYFKRFRMEIQLGHIPRWWELPVGCEWVAWDPALIPEHAIVKFRCFAENLDARLFPCLATREGCERLMRNISKQRGFIPEATWLVTYGDQPVGTVQGVRDGRRAGMIQNLGVAPEARRWGLGTAMLLRAAAWFSACRLGIGILEVTAENVGRPALSPTRLPLRRTLFRARRRVSAINKLKGDVLVARVDATSVIDRRGWLPLSSQPLGVRGRRRQRKSLPKTPGDVAEHGTRR